MGSDEKEQHGVGHGVERMTFSTDTSFCSVQLNPVQFS